MEFGVFGFRFIEVFRASRAWELGLGHEVWSGC